jgi:D-serine deaminase-like pyridoxal phosphate-dependent protein
MDQYQLYKNILTNESYPLAILDLDQLYNNIQVNIQRSKGKNIRIASKSIRSTEILKLIQKENDQFTGIMSYHAMEAIYLSKAGFKDILLGYPVADQALIQKIGEELKINPSICLMVDCPYHLELIQKEGEKLGVIFPVCIDIDLSIQFPGVYFGVKRSPINTKEKLIQLLSYLKKHNAIRLDGLMGYEAQIAGLADNAKEYGIKNKIIQLLKKRSIPKINNWRKEAVNIINKEGFNLKFINGGGTGSVHSTVEDPVVTEVTIGSGFFNPHLFDNYQNFQLQPSLLFGVQIVRIPKKGTFTCHGGGFIASGGIEKLKAPKVHLPKYGNLDKTEGAGEVQTPVIYNNDIELNIGDPIFFRHAKSGELCERFNDLIMIKDHKITNRAKTYRGEGLSFG